MLVTRIVATSAEVRATRSRTAKVGLLAACLREAHGAGDDPGLVISWLAGALRQRRTGLGWRSVQDLPQPADDPTLAVAEVDALFATMASLHGPGSQTARAALLRDLMSRATADEQQWLRRLITGEIRQGALDSVAQEALAAATDTPRPVVRRAAMLAGGTAPIARIAFEEGAAGLAAVMLEVGRPVLPMLASSAPDVAEALSSLGGRAAVETKLDGIRLQAHKAGSQVVLATRSLDVITDRLPEVVAVVRALLVDSVVLDGEAMWLADDGRPRPFQETASRTATTSDTSGHVTPYFFDVLHLDGRDLLDAPAHTRWAALDALVPERHRVARVIADHAEAAQSFADAALAAGHEGVVLKDTEAPYAAGRRGAAWVKVKPVHSVDLVVLAVEWGSGRRQGWLSNIHLGARDPATGRFVMVGKTFKGMTDAMLAWQTERFLELEVRRDGHVVHVRPEQVVEIAFDGVQTSTRYPGGVALRFARVLRYRDDKDAREADTIDTLRGQGWADAGENL